MRDIIYTYNHMHLPYTSDKYRIQVDIVTKWHIEVQYIVDMSRYLVYYVYTAAT